MALLDIASSMCSTSRYIFLLRIGSPSSHADTDPIGSKTCERWKMLSCGQISHRGLPFKFPGVVQYTKLWLVPESESCKAYVPAL